jgi:hypothetical protein
MGNLDKTKKAIGIDKIDDKNRKEMFEKFQSAGGKIIKEKEVPPPSNKSKPSVKTRPSTKFQDKGDSRSSSEKGSSSSFGGNYASGMSDSIQQSKAYSSLMDDEMGNFLNRMIVKFKCWANKITPFGASHLVPQFMSELNLEFRGALMEFKLASNELLANPEFSPKIAKALDKLSPIFIELIGRAGKIYDQGEIMELLDDYNHIPENTVPIKKVRVPLYSIFTKLYYLYPYQSTYKKAIAAAYDTLQRLENKPAMIYATKKKNTMAAISTVFDRFFEKLYLAVIRNENKNIPMISLYMENLLNIEEEEKPGKRKIGEELPLNAGGTPKEEEQAPAEEEEKVEEALDPELSKGLELLKESSIEGLRKKHDPRNELVELSDSDKCFLAYLYYKEFDYEYSIVLTTKRINIQPTSISGNKIDHKSKLLGIYEHSRGCMDQFKIYQDIYKEYIKVKNAPGANYIEYSKKLSQLETRRGQQSRNARSAIRDYIEKANTAFQALIDDMNGEKQIVANLDEVLSFDSVETKKKLNKKAVKDCIQEAYQYSYGLAYRLSEPNGDLYGGVLELTPEQMQIIYGRAIVSESSLDNSNPQNPAENENPLA